jgi:hypothetical protein
MRPLDAIAGSRVGIADELGSRRADTNDDFAVSILDCFLAAEVVTLVIVDVPHVVHRASPFGVVLVGECERLLLGVAVLHDVVAAVEQVDTDDTEFALGNVLTNRSDHHYLLSLVDSRIN